MLIHWWSLLGYRGGGRKGRYLVMRRRDFNTSLFGGLFLAFSGVESAFAQGYQPSDMIVYDHGKTAKLDPATRESQHIAGECTRLLQNATGVLRLPVTAELIDELKRGEFALELIFENTQAMQMVRLVDHSVTFKRMFVPLSGSFAENVSTIFLGSDEVYDSVPYRNNAHVAAMLTYIQNILDQTGARTRYPPF